MLDCNSTSKHHTELRGVPSYLKQPLCKLWSQNHMAKDEAPWILLRLCTQNHIILIERLDSWLAMGKWPRWPTLTLLIPPAVLTDPGAERRSKMVRANWEWGQPSACMTLMDNDLKNKYMRFVYRESWALWINHCKKLQCFLSNHNLF